MGPGQIESIKKGLDFAKALGIKYSLPVHPVSHTEAHCLTARMLGENQAKFPYLTVLVTGGHTEIVLTRGVGLHTILGFTIDLALGAYLDRIATEFQYHEKTLTDQSKIENFIKSYNARSANDQIPADYFDSILARHKGGPLLERLARYGN